MEDERVLSLGWGIQSFCLVAMSALGVLPLEVPVKSGCVMCVYHDKATWRAIKNAGNGDWQRAVMVDEFIRHKRPNYVCYLTPERKPLVDCDFSSQEYHGQMALWGEECQGGCWL